MRSQRPPQRPHARAPRLRLRESSRPTPCPRAVIACCVGAFLISVSLLAAALVVVYHRWPAPGASLVPVAGRVHDWKGAGREEPSNPLANIGFPASPEGVSVAQPPVHPAPATLQAPAPARVAHNSSDTWRRLRVFSEPLPLAPALANGSVVAPTFTADEIFTPPAPRVECSANFTDDSDAATNSSHRSSMDDANTTRSLRGLLGATSAPSPVGGVDSPDLARIFSSAPTPPCGQRGASLRTPADVAQRRGTFSACIALHPLCVSSQAAWTRLQKRKKLLTFGEPGFFIEDREALAAHGAELSAVISAFVAEHKLAPADWSGSVGWGGPWVEDHWRATFNRPVRFDISIDAAVARDASLSHNAIDDSGAVYLLTECTTGGGGVPICAPECTVSIADVRAIAAGTQRGGRGGVVADIAPRGRTCKGSPPPSWVSDAAVTSRQLALLMPYDTELFYPLVPLFVPWENIMFAAAARSTIDNAKKKKSTSFGDFGDALDANAGLASTSPRLVLLFGRLLESRMKHNVQYITVCQRPAGPWLARWPFRSLLAHTLILSSGGNGHVPLPLLARELPYLRLAGQGREEGLHLGSSVVSSKGTQEAELSQQLYEGVVVPPFGTAAASVSFYGDTRFGVRLRAVGIFNASVPRFVNGHLDNNPAVWVAPFVNTTLVLAPRGVGATSFRLYEALQLGIPPVFVYDRRPWLPYANPMSSLGSGMAQASVVREHASPFLPPPDVSSSEGTTPLNWDALAHIVEIDALKGWVERKLPDVLSLDAGGEAWGRMRSEMRRVRESHFSYDGVMRHIWRFLEDPWRAELQCSPPVPVDWRDIGM